jgi:ribonuclease PH
MQAVFKEAEVHKAPAGKLFISGHSEAVPSILRNTLDRNKEMQQHIMRKLMKQKQTRRDGEVDATVVIEEATSLAEVQGHEVDESFTREVFIL